MFRVGTRAEENGSRIVISTPFSHRNLTEKNKERKKKNGLVSLSTVEAAPKTIVRTLFDNKIAERRDRLWRIKKRTDIRGKIKVENNFLRILDKLSILFFFFSRSVLSNKFVSPIYCHTGVWKFFNL